MTDPIVYNDLSPAQLVELAVQRNEGRLAANGALVVETGHRTGRSPMDRYVVDEPSTSEHIHWGAINRPFPSDKFDALWDRVAAFVTEDDTFVSHLHVGADTDHYLPVKVTAQTAWHNLFANTLFIRPERFNPRDKQEWQILHAVNFQCDPQRDGTNSDGCVILNFAQRKILIAGMRYAGEMKKAMFSVQNFLLPEKDVLPMHCSANVGTKGATALSFGLSGTGKTTLSNDPDRRLIGDDEHGWSQANVFNLEGGCYAKVIDLSESKEPQIYKAIRYGALLENIDLKEDGHTPDYQKSTITQNTRVSYPIYHIDNIMYNSRGDLPRNIFFLTCDAFGVLPPISKLTPEQAMYHFISGYTAKIAGTEAGITEPLATLSACFGAPFIPLHPTKYGDMLGNKLKDAAADGNPINVWLVNTGWSGGAYGTGSRMELAYTRALIKAALTGAFNGVEFHEEPFFGLSIPRRCPDVPNAILNPRDTWRNEDEYDATAKKLTDLFNNNFNAFAEAADAAVVAAGPKG